MLLAVTQFALLALLSTKVTANEKPISRIVGGIPARIEKFPYQVSIQLDFGKGMYQHFCGAAIISKNWAVTAGHCIEKPEGKLVARVGSSFWNSGGQIHEMHNLKIHTHEIMDDDIGMFQVRPPFKFSEKVQPIDLQTSEVPVGSLVYITGWGRESEIGPMTPQLQQVSLPIISAEDCKKAYSFGVNSRTICAGLTRGGKDACQGDSGGPMAFNGTLVGIVSWGNGCAQPKMPGVYTKISSFVKWIKKLSGI